MGTIKKENFFSISDSDIESLSNFFDVANFQQMQEVIYEGHTPNAGFILLEGDLSLKKKNKIVDSFKKNFCYGFYELINNKKSKFSVAVNKGSKLFILDRSSLNELKTQSPDLFQKLIVS